MNEDAARNTFLTDNLRHAGISQTSRRYFHSERSGLSLSCYKALPRMCAKPYSKPFRIQLQPFNRIFFDRILENSSEKRFPTIKTGKTAPSQAGPSGLWILFSCRHRPRVCVAPRNGRGTCAGVCLYTAYFSRAIISILFALL